MTSSQKSEALSAHQCTQPPGKRQVAVSRQHRQELLYTLANDTRPLECGPRGTVGESAACRRGSAIMAGASPSAERGPKGRSVNL
jgi:hypothetical protein